MGSPSLPSDCSVTEPLIGGERRGGGERRKYETVQVEKEGLRMKEWWKGGEEGGEKERKNGER